MKSGYKISVFSIFQPVEGECYSISMLVKQDKALENGAYNYKAICERNSEILENGAH